MFDRLNQFIGIYLDLLRRLFTWPIWGLLLVNALLVYLILYIHVHALSPTWYGLMSAWTGLVSEDGSRMFFHYPGQFIQLNFFFSWAKQIYAILLESLFLGTAAALFMAVFNRERLPMMQALRQQVSRWPHLMLAALILNGLFALIGYLLPTILAPWLVGYNRRLLAFQFGIMPLVYTILAALLFYMIPLVAGRGRTAWTAAWESIKTAARRPIASFFLAAIALAVPVLLAGIINRPDIIVTKFRPEATYLLLVAAIVVDLFANFVWIGTASRILTQAPPQR